MNNQLNKVLFKDKVHMEMLDPMVRGQHYQSLEHSLVERNNGWIIHRISEIGVINKKLQQTQEFHTNQLYRPSDLMETLIRMVRGQPSQVLDHSSEARSNGWTALRILEIGEKIKWSQQTLEFPICQQPNTNQNLFNLMKSTTLVSSEMPDLKEKDQLYHHHNRLLEVRSNG